MPQQTAQFLPLFGMPGEGAAAPGSVMAWRGNRPVTRTRFIHDVLAVAARLPDATHVINICNDGYRFLVGFAAAVARGQVTLMPPSRVPGVVVAIAEDYPQCCLLVDSSTADGALPQFRIELEPEVGADSAAIAATLPHELPAIDPAQLAAILFTSGSTGKATPNPKQWGTLVRGALATAQATLPAAAPATVTTVPPQHMYGFETTMLLPLLGRTRLQCDRPLFPADLHRALAQTPEPRWLVTTPVHLRTFVESGLTMPRVAGITSATAPLSPELAEASERLFQAPLIEVFGSTETGVTATRRTVRDEPWHAIDLFDLEPQAGGTRVTARHFPHEVWLQDVIEPEGPRHFRLVGRSSDLVNIAGKRASLGDLNAKLLAIDGVRDGVIFMPDRDARNEADGSVHRTAALVVAPGMTREALLAAMRQVIDPAFLPRPLLLVDALPRNETSKLPRAALLDLYARHARDTRA
jgi:acyl-coenzyme A synthetase/AMP-(fatty) acid ligase